jgi:hypothetical protein
MKDIANKEIGRNIRLIYFYYLLVNYKYGNGKRYIYLDGYGDRDGDGGSRIE